MPDEQGTIIWDYAEEHMWLQHRILITWAKEACQDPDRLIFDPDPKSRSGRSMRIIGYSHRGAKLITVIVVRDGANLYAATAWSSSARESTAYRLGILDV